MPGSILGNRVLRKEDPKFLTTGGVYMDDLRDESLLAGAAYVTYVRSTAAHARILSIDTSAALEQPGVIGIFTGADLGLEPLPAPFNPAVARPLLAMDVVRYVGEPIAAVVTDVAARSRRHGGADSIHHPAALRAGDRARAVARAGAGRHRAPRASAARPR